jgi:hypothetical protein
MTGSGKRLLDLGRKLKNNNPEIVKATITALRNENPFSGAIHLLAETFNTAEDQEIRNKIRDFMNDMKESGLREEVVVEIKKGYKPETIQMLVSSCWQSGLDYSPYSTDLASVFTQSDYQVALECFTVIEEFSHRLTRRVKEQIILLLNENKENITDEKSALLSELVAVLN